MWNTPCKKRLQQIPRLYLTDFIPSKDKLIYLHFFIFNCDWYIAEYDGADTFFGFTVLNHDLQNAEWGYISFKELKSISIKKIEVDCELQNLWKIRPAREVAHIKDFV